MTLPEKITSALLDIAGRFDSEGIEYMVMGGMAVPFWGIPHTTFDLDLALKMEGEAFIKTLRVIESLGFSVSESARKGFLNSIPGGMREFKATSYTPEGNFDIDFFPLVTEYQRTAFERRREAEIVPGRKVWLIAPEDLVLHKLLAGRKKDLASVEGILAMQGLESGIDLDYMRKWADMLGIRKQLEEMLAGE